MDLQLGDTRLIIDACKSAGLLRNQAAYVLATAYHESAHTMKPVRETLASTDAKAKEILTKAWKAGKLPWVKSDYWSSGYFGRGYVQLTHKANYERASRELGLPMLMSMPTKPFLVGNPHEAMNPTYAVPILVRGMKEGWFTGKKLSDYITLSSSDYTGARRIINGTDKASLISDIAIRYNSLLRSEGYGEEAPPAPVVPPKPVVEPKPVPAAPVPPVARDEAGFWSSLVVWALSQFKR